jgi:cytochrome b
MADTKLLFAGIGLLIGGIMSLATSAIGTQCYNDNEEYGKSKGSNYSFLVFNLVTAILIVLSAGVAIYYSFKKPKVIEDIVTTTAESSA